MVFETVSSLSASLIIVVRRFILLIISPYKTMRKIAAEDDYWQPIFILLFVFIYFEIANKIRRFNYQPIIIFIVFLFFFIFTTSFFYLLSRIFNKKDELKSFFFSFSYTLFPTLIWFISNSVLYNFLPPPRTMSLMGRGFSIFFITFSLSLLIWKGILVYLSVRFSSRLSFFRIMFFMILYLSLFFPISVFLYQMKIFRVPFI